MHFIDYILLTIGIIFNFFIPGYIFAKYFLSEFDSVTKIPLYLIFSVLLSTNITYIFAFFFGLNIYVIFFTYLIWLILFVLTKNKSLKIYDHKASIVVGLLVFIIYLISLYPAIFYKYGGYYVMSADNWQDTALHLSIIQSIKSGNFPPKAPYFSGNNLTYHYFTDLHTSIITLPLNKFFPRFLILDNTIFALIFYLSLYALIYFLTKNNAVSLVVSFASSFAGGLIFLKFINDYLNGAGSIKSLILSGKYVLEYGGLYQMTPITNYFLQNRPMMAGLPIFVVGILLIMRKKYLTVIILAILSLKFQLFVSLVVLLTLLIKLCIERNKYVLLLGVFCLIGTFLFKDYLVLFVNNFKFEPWFFENDNFWYIKFLFGNFGIYFVGYLIFITGVIIKKIKLTKDVLLILLVAISLMVVPFIGTFTIDRFDMLKFFYLAFVPLSLFASLILNRVNHNKISIIIAILFLLTATSSGFIDLAGSYLNKNLGYTSDDLEIGNWIAGNTPKKSVFITYPSVHSPVSDIAGRLRIMSYSQWPYTHGFNIGSDNVFIRQDDIARFYETGDVQILNKYGATYVYLGNDELSNFPTSKNNIESNIDLKLVYEKNGTKIYRKI